MGANDQGSMAYRLQTAPTHLLRLAQQRLTEIFAEQTRGELTLRQFTLLLTVHQCPGSTQSDLVAMTGIDRSTIGDIIDRLARRGLVSRERSGEDQRANKIHVMPSGLATLTEALPAARETQDRFLEPVPAELRPTFLALLRRIADVPEPPVEITPAEPRAVVGAAG
jgi:DNA-binding MarR family transcriptional regulator